jgi:hypothetical protein
MSRTPKDSLEGWGWFVIIGAFALFLYAMYEADLLDNLYRDVTRLVHRLF